MNRKHVVIKSDRKRFFRHWMTLTKPFHKLRPKEMDVLALLIYHYYEFRKKISDDKLAWKMVFDYDTKIKIKEDLDDMPDSSFQNLLSALRREKVLITKDYEHVSPTYMPKVSAHSKRFDLIFSILIDEQANKKLDKGGSEKTKPARKHS